MKLQRSGIQVAGTAAAVLAGIGLVTAVPASAATPGSWTSVQPGVAQTGCDGVRATVALDANGTLALGATWNCRQALIPAPIGLVTSQVDFTTGLEFVSRTDAPVSYNYEVTAGKSRVRTRPATETRLVFAKGSAQMTVHVRTSADGMALRYELPSGATVLREATSFELPTDAQLSRQVFSPDHERGQGVAGSNPVSPTAKGFSQVRDLREPLFRV